MNCHSSTIKFGCFYLLKRMALFTGYQLLRLSKDRLRARQRRKVLELQHRKRAAGQGDGKRRLHDDDDGDDGPVGFRVHFSQQGQPSHINPSPFGPEKLQKQSKLPGHNHSDIRGLWQSNSHADDYSSDSDARAPKRKRGPRHHTQTPASVVFGPSSPSLCSNSDNSRDRDEQQSSGSPSASSVSMHEQPHGAHDSMQLWRVETHSRFGADRSHGNDNQARVRERESEPASVSIRRSSVSYTGARTGDAQVTPHARDPAPYSFLRVHHARSPIAAYSTQQEGSVQAKRDLAVLSESAV